MKKILGIIALLGLAASVFATGKADAGKAADPAAEWPKQPINVIVTHGAGGDTDYNARLISRYLEKKLGVSIVVNNVTGANGNIAMAQYKDGAKDGYTFVFTNTAALTGNEVTGLSDFGYDSFEPVCLYGKQSGENIIVPATSPYKTLGDLIQASKDKPNTIKFGISTGGGVYIASVIMAQNGAQFANMDQGDGAARMTALLGGHVDATDVPYATARQYIEAGKVRTLATLLSESPSLLKDIPTASQTIPDLKIDTLYVALAPKGTPASIVEKMNAAMKEIILNDPEYKAECQKFNLQDPWALNVADTTAGLKSQRDLFMKFSAYLKK